MPGGRTDWGTMADAKSRLRELAKRIERRELAPVYPAESDLAKRRRRRAAKLMALAEYTMAMIGTDPTATARKEMLLRKAAELELKRVLALAHANGHGKPQADLARQIQHELTAPDRGRALMATLTRYVRDPVGFIDDFIPLNEKRQPWRLAKYQRGVLASAFRWDALGRLLLRLLLWAEMKKSGKSFLAALLTIWWGMVTPHTEIILIANDLEQTLGRVFKTVVDLLRANPRLTTSATILSDEIRLSNGTVILPRSSDYKGLAGSRHSLYVVDEPWGIMQESAIRVV